MVCYVSTTSVAFVVLVAQGNNLSTLAGSQLCISITFYNKSLWFLRLGNNPNVFRKDRMLIGKVLRRNRQEWVESRLPTARPQSRSNQATPDSFMSSDSDTRQTPTTMSVDSEDHGGSATLKPPLQLNQVDSEDIEGGGVVPLSSVLLRQATNNSSPRATARPTEVPKIYTLFTSPLVAQTVTGDYVALDRLDYEKEREALCEAVAASGKDIALDISFASTG